MPADVPSEWAAPALHGNNVVEIACDQSSTRIDSSAPQSSHFIRLWKLLGPGFMYASSAIGVSHLVQCTRAGALYGFVSPATAVVVSCILKYPFFEFSSRYANTTGKSLVDGYRELSHLAVVACLVLMLSTCAITLATITAVTSAFVAGLFLSDEPSSVQSAVMSAVLMVGCWLLVSFGGFRRLDLAIKVITAALVITTVVAVAIAAFNTLLQPVSVAASTTTQMPNASSPLSTPPRLFSVDGIGFLVALAGWMPTPVDLGSIMSSLWTVARYRDTGYHPPLPDALLEFGVAYAGTAILGIAFVALGALLAPERGTALPSEASAFARAVVALYTAAIGESATALVGVSAVSAMVGTLLTLVDGFARAITHALYASLGWPNAARDGLRPYQLAAFTASAAGYGLLVLMSGSSLSSLVDLATTVSFLIGPIIGSANAHLVTRPTFPAAARPSRAMRLLASAGIALLTALAGLYVMERTGLGL